MPASAGNRELHIEDVPNPNQALLVGLITGSVYNFQLLGAKILARLVFSEALRDINHLSSWLLQWPPGFEACFKHNTCR